MCITGVLRHKLNQPIARQPTTHITVTIMCALRATNLCNIARPPLIFTISWIMCAPQSMKMLNIAMCMGHITTVLTCSVL